MGRGRAAGIVALSMRTGKVVWSRAVAPGSESSPIVWDNTVYFGDQAGTMYALRATNGSVVWTYHASAAVKGGPAYADGRVFFGDYAGRAYSLTASNGHVVWATNTSGADFGFGSGNFYSTPAVAFGRVYMGNTDGRVYSFAERNGQLAWATETGSYVYASPAVADLPGLGPTVYLGSYNGLFYAFAPVRAHCAVVSPRRRADLGLGHDRRRRRLLLGPRVQTTDGARRPLRQDGVLIRRRSLQSGRLRTPARSI